jgi:type I restriction enzyme, S subunit
MTGAVGLRRVPSAFLRSAEIPLPDLGEQRRIVEEIEKQFSRLDAALAGLQRVRASLKRYKTSIIARGLDGSLANADGLVSEADRVTARQGWTSFAIRDLAQIDVGFAFRSAGFAKEGIRLLRGENIEPGSLRWTETRYWPLDRVGGYENLLLRAGDIILAMDRPLVTAGLKLARVKNSDLPCLLVQRVARVRCHDERLEPFLYLAMSATSFERHLLRGQTGTQLPHISAATIAAYVIDVPPLADQNGIVAEVDRRLSVVRALEAEVDINLKRAQALRQTVLAKHFSLPNESN